MLYEVGGQIYYSPKYLEALGLNDGDKVLCIKTPERSYLEVDKTYNIVSIHKPNTAWYNKQHPDRLVLENPTGFSIDVSGIGCTFELLK